MRKLFSACAMVESETLKRIEGNQWTGNVHSVFQNVINVSGEEGAIFSICSAQIDLAHDALRFEWDDLRLFDAYPGQHVTVQGKRLYFGSELCVEIGEYEDIALPLPCFTHNTERLLQNLRVDRRHLVVSGKRGGMLFAPSSDLFTRAVSKELTTRRRLIGRALQKKDALRFMQHAQEVVGLGHGLTPSGDDFLSGLLLVFSLPNNPLSSFASKGEALVALAKRQTNELSAWMLWQASQGRARQCVCNWIHHLISSHTPETKWLDEVLQIGSLSGSDIAVGVLSGLTASTKIK